MLTYADVSREVRAATRPPCRVADCFLKSLFQSASVYVPISKHSSYASARYASLQEEEEEEGGAAAERAPAAAAKQGDKQLDTPRNVGAGGGGVSPPPVFFCLRRLFLSASSSLSNSTLSPGAAPAGTKYLLTSTKDQILTHEEELLPSQTLLLLLVRTEAMRFCRLVGTVNTGIIRKAGTRCCGVARPWALCDMQEDTRGLTLQKIRGQARPECNSCACSTKRKREKRRKRERVESRRIRLKNARIRQHASEMAGAFATHRQQVLTVLALPVQRYKY
jgi:hypothetical protein